MGAVGFALAVGRFVAAAVWERAGFFSCDFEFLAVAFFAAAGGFLVVVFLAAVVLAVRLVPLLEDEVAAAGFEPAEAFLAAGFFVAAGFLAAGFFVAAGFLVAGFLAADDARFALVVAPLPDGVFAAGVAFFTCRGLRAGLGRAA